MARQSKLNITHWVTQGYCDSCRHTRQEEGDSPHCTLWIAVMRGTSGIQLFLKVEGSDRADTFRYYPHNAGCTHWEPELPPSLARVPGLELLEELQGSLREWREEYPEHFLALFQLGREQHASMSWKAAEHLRFFDGRIYMGLRQDAPTRAGLIAYAQALNASQK